MAASQKVIKLLLVVALLFTTFQLPSFAVEYLGSEKIDQTATLTGPRAEAPVPLYLRPAINQPNVGYGMTGDPVTVMEQLADFLPEADPNNAWNHVRLQVEPFTEGWVQGRFLLLDKETTDAN